MNTSSIFGCVALVAVLAGTVALIILHFAPTGLHPLRDPVSGYGLTRYGSGYRAAAILLGSAGAADAVGLLSSLGLRAVLSAIFLFIFAAARIAISRVPMDRPGSKTKTGRMHNILAFAAFASATASAFLAYGAVGSDAHLRGLQPFDIIFATAMAAGSAGTILSFRLRFMQPWFGAWERVIYVGMIGWLATAAIASLTAVPF